MASLLASLLKETGNEYAAVAEDGITAGDVTGFVDTGSYTLNALLSGSIYGGLASNKVTAFAGEPSTGKTFYALSVVKDFLNSRKDAIVFYFESEAAISRQMLEERGVDTSRFVMVPVTTVQEFRTQAIKVLNSYMETPEKDRAPLLMVLDSLGNLSTEKEIEDITAGKDTRDMTRPQLIKGAFRVLTLKLGKAKVPLIITNHIYDVIGCALAGTQIIMADNTLKSIENITIGESVNTLVGPKSVTQVFSYGSTEHYEVVLENGVIYKLTGEHKLMVQTGEWKEVKNLTEEDVVVVV